MKLLPSEIDSPLWRKIEAELTQRLMQLRTQNDADLSQEDTAKARGRIAETKLMLGWATTIEPIVFSD